MKIRLAADDPLLGRQRLGLSAEATVETRGEPAPTEPPSSGTPTAVEERTMPTDAGKASLRQWLTVAAAILGPFTSILGIRITNSSLSDIEGALGASSDEGSWIYTAYLMAEIIVIPLTGWLGSIFGLRRFMPIATGLFIGFSVACALSTSLPEMILVRAGQGFTGGVLIPPPSPSYARVCRSRSRPWASLS